MENQDDNAGFHEKMFFLCTCILGQEGTIEAEGLQLAGRGVASRKGGCRIWSVEHARGDNTSEAPTASNNAGKSEKR